MMVLLGICVWFVLSVPFAAFLGRVIHGATGSRVNHNAGWHERLELNAQARRH